MSHSSSGTELHGQYSVAAAKRLPQPDAADRRALAEISSGPAPTAGELAEAMAGMEHVAAVPDVRPDDPAEAARLDRQLGAARAAARRLRTPDAATRAGYRLASGFLPGIGAHWIDWSRVTRPFDPASPAMLLFDRESPSSLVGLSYFVRSDSEPTGFGAGGAHWHRHAGLCIVHGVLVAEGVAERSDCDHGHGTLVPGRDLWMLHAWVVPGRENPLGTFAALHSGLCTATAPCTPDGATPAATAPTVPTTAPAHVHMSYRRPKPHAPVDGLHARNVSPIVVEVSRDGWKARPSTAERRRADRLVRETVATLRRYRRLDAAIADGYIPLPEDPIHWYRPDFMTDGKVLDPSRPESLVYLDPTRSPTQLRSDEPPDQLARRVVVGAMYWAGDLPEHGPQPGGPLTVWHFHEWTPGFFCGDGHGFPVSFPADGHCATGTPMPRTAEMLHVWTVKTPDGPFASSMEFLSDPTPALRTNMVK